MTEPFPAKAALRDALKTGVVAGLLAFPVLALRAEPDFSNKLVLQKSLNWSLIAAFASFALCLSVALLPAPKPGPSTAPPSDYLARIST